MNYQGLSILNGIINLVVVCFAATNHSSVCTQFTALSVSYLRAGTMAWKSIRI